MSGEEGVFGDVGAPSEGGLRVHGIGEEVLVRQLGGRHLEVGIGAPFHLGGDVVGGVEVALADLEDGDGGGEVGELEDGGVVEG